MKLGVATIIAVHPPSSLVRSANAIVARALFCRDCGGRQERRLLTVEQQLERELMPTVAAQQRGADVVRLREAHLAQLLQSGAECNDGCRVDSAGGRSNVAEEVCTVEEFEQLHTVMLLGGARAVMPQALTASASNEWERAQVGLWAGRVPGARCARAGAASQARRVAHRSSRPVPGNCAARGSR